MNDIINDIEKLTDIKQSVGLFSNSTDCFISVSFSISFIKKTNRYKTIS